MEILKQLRKENKKTQQQVATYLNVSQVAYSKYENGKAEPSFDVLSKLADYFNVSIDTLIGRKSEKRLSEKQNQLLQLLQQLDSDEMEKIIDYASLIKQARK